MHRDVAVVRSGFLAFCRLIIHCSCRSSSFADSVIQRKEPPTAVVLPTMMMHSLPSLRQRASLPGRFVENPRDGHFKGSYSLMMQFDQMFDACGGRLTEKTSLGSESHQVQLWSAVCSEGD